MQWKLFDQLKEYTTCILGGGNCAGGIVLQGELSRGSCRAGEMSRGNSPVPSGNIWRVYQGLFVYTGKIMSKRF